MKNKNFSLIDKIGLSLFGLAFLFVVFIGLSRDPISFNISFNSSESSDCSVEGIGFHNDVMAIKFNSDGRFNSSDFWFDIPKSFWGTWEQKGNQIITTNDRSTTGMGIGQKNTYTYDCNKLTISGDEITLTLYKD